MLHRRELLTALLGSQVAWMSGCSGKTLPSEGQLLGTNFQFGHRVRDGHRPQPDPTGVEEVDVIVVGGGIAGLSAAWRLQQAAVDDFVVLEMETAAGGTARSGRDGALAYPWGAHYLPTPMRESSALLQLLAEMDVVVDHLDDGTPVVAEQYLCRDPEERVFYQGRWHEGLFPAEDASADDLRQLDDFRQEIDRWVARRDQQDRRMFAIPTSSGSDDPEVMALDGQSMADWMEKQGWTSPRLRWLVDYSCRDDYGLGVAQTSAWAGLFYFASRIDKPGDPSQAVITWPEGNGRIVRHLADRCGSRLRSGLGVTQITADDAGVHVTAVDLRNDRPIGFRAKRLICAVPQFLVPHLVPSLDDRRRQNAKQFQYGSWLVANVHLRDRPAENGFPMCWDNVIYGSRSLGYVTSTHQTGSDHGPTVLTWYYPFSDVEPKISRAQLLTLGWSDWAEVVLSDLEVPHPDIRPLVTRLDIMRWGHAMIQPRVGFVSSPARIEASRPAGPIHFAGTDLSGIALMEEAFDHGLRAAEEVLQAMAVKSESVI